MIMRSTLSIARPRFGVPWPRPTLEYQQLEDSLSCGSCHGSIRTRGHDARVVVQRLVGRRLNSPLAGRMDRSCVREVTKGERPFRHVKMSEAGYQTLLISHLDPDQAPSGRSLAGAY